MSDTPLYESLKIAIVDDHNVVREGIVSLMSTYPQFHFIISACNGRELLNKLDGAKELPDICLLDINMPDVNGYQTIQQLTKLYPLIKVLVLTAHDDDFSIMKMMQLGANGYLVKCCQPEELYEAMLTIHKEGQYLSNEVIAATNSVYRSKLIQFRNYLLTKKEVLFLHFCCTELSYKQIADKMHISPRTVDDYRIKLFKKLKVKTRVGLAIYAVQSGIEAFYESMNAMG